MHKPDIITKYGAKFLLGDLGTVAHSAPAAPSSHSTADVKEFYNPDLKNLKGSTVQSWNSGGTAGELPAERAKATFNVPKLTNVLDGGPENTERRHFILGPLQKARKPPV